MTTESFSIFREQARCSFYFIAMLLMPSLGGLLGAREKSPHEAAFAVLEKSCLGCHNASEHKGDVILDRAPLKVEALAHIAESVSGDDPDMPKKGDRLSAADVAVLVTWVQAGAPIPEGRVLADSNRSGADWWSVQPIKKTPTIKQGMVDDPTGFARRGNPLDSFILAKLSENDLKPSPEADRRTLIRRLYFDLIGLPPSPEDVAAFLADQSPDAYEKLVDELLDSPRFGERWARHWLDIAHYADTHGFERDKRRDNAWWYRDYVIDAFNSDKPYDRFLREQIAGDVLWPDDADAVVATGFLAAGPFDFVGQVETKSDVLRRSARALDLDDMTTQVMTAATAITINCARCHDHKLDPISQEEYYQLTAVFAGIKRDERDISEADRARYVAEKDGA